MGLGQCIPYCDRMLLKRVFFKIVGDDVRRLTSPLMNGRFAEQIRASSPRLLQGKGIGWSGFGSWKLSGAWILGLGVFLLFQPCTLHSQPGPTNRVLELDGTGGYVR